MSSVSASWRKIAETDDIRRSSQVITVAHDHINIFGGELKPRQPVNNHLYQIPLNHEKDGARTLQPSNAPSPRVGTASTTLNGKTYLYSGRGGEAMAPIEENGSLHVYDGQKGVWSVLAPSDSSTVYPPARSYHAMTSNGKDVIYVHAGCPEHGRLSDLWAFDIGRREWKQLGSAPEPGRGGTSVAFLNGKLYRMNGFDGQNEQGFALDIYDPQTNTWNTKTWEVNDGPPARSVSTLLPMQMGGKDILVTMFGESDPSSLGHQGAGRMLEDVWAYDVTNEKWMQMDMGHERPKARGWFAADVLTGKNAAVVHGGLAEDNSRLGDVWMLSV